MRKPFLFFFMLTFASTFSQSKKQIDSINNLDFQKIPLSNNQLISLFKDNVGNAKKLSYDEGLAEAYLKLGLVYSYQGNYLESTDLTFKAIKIYEKLGSNSKIAEIYTGTGYAMKYRDIEKGKELMQKGIKISQAENNEDFLKDAYNNYGVLMEIENKLDSAIFYYNEGLRLKIKLKDDFGIPYSLSNLGGAYGLKKEYGKAERQFTEAIKQRKILQDSIGLAESLTQLSELYLLQDNNQQAITLIRISTIISEKKEYHNLSQYNYKLLSDIYKKQNIADSALYYFEKYKAVNDSIHSQDVQEKIAKLSIEFETEKKENQILQQNALIVEKDLQVKSRNNIIFGSLGLALILGLLGYLLFSQQKLKNKQLQKEGELKTALSKIETQNKLQEQRLRISRDLHDNIGAQLTFIISSIDNLKYGFSDITEKLGDKLSGISSFTSQTIYELRDTIWAMNKENITFEDLQSRIANFIDQAKNASNMMDFSFNIGDDVDEQHVFTSVEGMNIYRIIQEAVNNALKYAAASEIEVNILKDNGYKIEILDNGKGFDQDIVELGNGINNMKKRSREIGGKLEIDSTPRNGSKITITL